MSNADDLILVADNANVRTWCMNFAPVNALHPDFLSAFERRIAEAEADGSVAAVVLTSALKVFSGGGDAGWMASVKDELGPEGLVDEFNRTMDRFRRVCVSLRQAPFLTVAAMNGHTLAGGLELAAACDLRFCSTFERLQIGVPEMDLFGAMPSGGGGAQFLARLLGPTRALRFILDAKPVGPAKALELGLVEQLFEPDALLPGAEAFAADVARKAGRIGVSAAKRAVFGGAELPLGAAMELDRSVHWDCMRRGNFLPGVEAFTQKFGKS
ncbi:enoyl-CoA hydratase/isomerase family protein [Amorphus sp. MBR-141]